MMTDRIAKAMLLGLAVMLATTPAEAMLRRAVYTGTIFRGVDQFGLFGTPNAQLAGLSYTATYIYDTAMPGSFRELPPQPDRVYGGANFAPTVPVSPMLSATLVINGHSYSQYTGFYGFAGITAEGGMVHLAVDRVQSGGFIAQSSLINTSTVAPANLMIDGSLAPTIAPTNGGLFTHTVTYDDNATFADATFAEFTGDALVSIGGVPEPASWALMIGGFGMVGGTLRNRRRAFA